MSPRFLWNVFENKGAGLVSSDVCGNYFFERIFLYWHHLKTFFNSKVNFVFFPAKKYYKLAESY